jgi:NAD(P)-dependent dehydrogenase (short-subunit alcohol dehydrogenase family)
MNKVRLPIQDKDRKRPVTASSLPTRTAVITGGNSGLGLETARAIGRDPNWHLVLACRDPGRAAAAVADLKQSTGNSNIEARALDLLDNVSVRAFVSGLRGAGLPPLKLLICNAGIQFVAQMRFNEAGVEGTFQTNHLGHYLLTRLLLPDLAAPARILLVASGTHDPKQKTGLPAPRFTSVEYLANPPADPEFDRDDPGKAGRRAYSTSKLCNIMTAYELARRLDPATVTVNAFDPGLMPGSGLARDYGFVMRLAWRFILPAARLFVRNVNSTQISGQALANLATAERYAGVTGRYFEGEKEIPSSDLSYDRGKSALLWAGSAALAGLDAA